MTLGFGLLSAQLRPGEDQDWTRAYDETLRIAREAERLGYSSVWTTEHHFVDDGYMPSLLVTSAAIAAQTEDIEIGTGVLLAPMHDPLRLAEDAATVQLISGGRLILGLGIGWSRMEFSALGPGKRVRGRAMEEILSILPRAWSGDVFEHQGDVYSLPRLAVRPTPAAPIPVVIGGGAEVAVRRAGRLANGLFSNASPDQFIQHVQWAADEMETAGRDPGAFRWIYYMIIYPAADTQTALDEIGRDLWQLGWKYGDMEDSATRTGPIPAAPSLGDRSPDPLRFRPTLVGPSDWIVEQLLEVRHKAGVPVEFVARSYFPTLPYRRQLELMEQLAVEVAPHL